LAIKCQDIADPAAIDISPFKTCVQKQPKPPFILTFLLLAITRDQDVFNLLASNRRAVGTVVKRIQLRLWNSFYHKHGSSSEAHGFHVCGSCFGAVAILELKKWLSHYRVKEKSRESSQT